MTVIRRQHLAQGTLFALLLAALVACGNRDAGTGPGGTARAWSALVSAWIESDHQGYPDWSEAGLAAETLRLQNWRARVVSVEAAGLGDDARRERDILLAVINRRLFWQETADWPHRHPGWYALTPPVTDQQQAMARWAANLPKATAQIKANLRGPLPRAYIDAGIQKLDGLAKSAPAEAGVAALADLRRHLVSLRASATGEFALGPGLFARMLLATEGVDSSVPQLQAAGLTELKRNLAALQSVCAQFAPGQSIHRCLATSAGAQSGTQTQIQMPAYDPSLDASPALSEGWLEYAEALKQELGAGDGNAALRVRQVHNALVHDVQLLTAIGLHAQGMTLAESKQLFIESAFLDEPRALQEAERVAGDPTLLNPALGRIVIRGLLTEWCAKRGSEAGPDCSRDFHATFMRYRNLPIPQARAAMLATLQGT